MASKKNDLKVKKYEDIFNIINDGNLSELQINVVDKKDQKVFTKISILIVSLKFLWFIGHVIVVYNSIINSTLAKVNTSYSNSYHKALIGAIISNGVLIYKTHGIPDLASSWFENICKDENFHYLLLAVIFNFTKPLFFILYPFCIYSIFHMANFIYSEFLSTTPEKKISKKIYNFISKYQEPSIKKIAKFEILIVFPMLFVAAICRQASLLAFLTYGRFLYMRYNISPTVRELWDELKKACELKIEEENIPKYVKFSYYTIVYIFREFILSVRVFADDDDDEKDEEKEKEEEKEKKEKETELIKK